jgi:hypothetical protein
MLFLRALRRVLFAIVMFAVIGGSFSAFYLDYILPFDLSRSPNLLTNYHLRLLKDDPERCLAALDRGSADYLRVPPLAHENGCGYSDAARLQDSGVDYGNRILLRCPALLATLLWERHVLVPAAQAHFSRAPVSVRQLGTYSCRSISGRGSEVLSQHAYANAIDIASVTLQGGEMISVLRDWEGEDAKARFLRALRDGACRIFSVTLSPAFNEAHANHFHFDMGGRSICR